MMMFIQKFSWVELLEDLNLLQDAYGKFKEGWFIQEVEDSWLGQD